MLLFVLHRLLMTLCFMCNVFHWYREYSIPFGGYEWHLMTIIMLFIGLCTPIAVVDDWQRVGQQCILYRYYAELVRWFHHDVYI